MSFNRTMLNSLSRTSRVAIKKSSATRLACPGLRNSLLSPRPTNLSFHTARTMATAAANQQPSILGQNGLLKNNSRPAPAAAKPVQKRGIADDERIGKIYSFEDIKSMASKDKSVVIVDSREPHELAELGRIPGAINIPIDTAPDSYSISEEDFEERFGYARPPKDAHLVTYCRSGVRCHTAAELAKQAGFTNVNEYPGSFNDWSSNGGEIERK